MRLKYDILKQIINFDPKDKYSCGVYTITHIKYPNNLYVGSADSNKKYDGLFRRWKTHYSDLLHNKHHNIKLQRVVNKHGIDGLRFEIVEICESGYSVEAEQYWINMLNPYYNICKSAYSSKGYKHTEKHIKKVSKTVYRYDLSGNYLDCFINSVKAEEITNIDKGSIRNCCIGKYKRAGNFIWKYEYKEKILPYENKSSKRIITYKNGNFFKEFDSILQASRELLIPVGNISKHIKNNTSLCYGYVFKEYYDNYHHKIKISKRTHKYQVSVAILDIETNITFKFESFNKVNKFISKCTLSKHYKNNNLEFIHKNKYKIKLIPNNLE